MKRNSTYRLGKTDIFETLAVYYQLWLADSIKALSGPSRLHLASHLDLDANPRILEIGPRSGTVTAAHLSSLKTKLTLFDKWGHYKQWAIMRRTNPNLKIVMGDADAPLPFPSNSFECCIHMATINYLHHPAAALEELFRILVPGGKLIISCIKKEGNLAYENGLLDVKHMPTFWDRRVLLDTLEGLGFKIDESREFGISPPRFAEAYRKYTSFFHYDGLLYDFLASKYPGHFSLTGAVATKPLHSPADRAR